MADVIHVERGYAPWKPSADARLVKEYQHYDIPLMGVVEQHDVRFYFACLSGADEPVNVWIYVHLSPDDETNLDAVSTPDVFRSTVAFHGPAVLVLAAEGPGIIAVEVMDEVTEDDLIRAFDGVKRQLDELVATAHTLEPV